MRILIYGFGPYRQFRTNITGKILRRLPRGKGLRKIVFPVRFDRRQFTNALERYEPDLIIGLGQCSRGSKLRIEARALNQRRNRKTDPPKKIARTGASELKTNLRVAYGGVARRSRCAGDYVCNYSMYVMLNFLQQRREGTLYGFIHIPHDYDAGKAARFVEDLLRKMLKRGSAPL
jgi:pyrrolidone-carboxylate peptidase